MPACVGHADLFAIGKDRRKKEFIKYKQVALTGFLSKTDREQSGEERGYIPVPRQQNIGAPVPGTVKQVSAGGGGGGVEEVKGSD